MRYAELTEKWSKKYKSSINCNNPKGFSQKAHCAGRKKNESVEKQITDQDSHVEVRGKKNYEIDGYDPKDKLHQVLDKLDPATVAKLYGGEEVFLNPKNSRTAPAIAMAKKLTTENFADGKVKGKSRPGRVKRAGASCKGSVTSLRAKAKKSSGEKAKMYHWCANMKSGRKK